jgi:hypothetical protein
MTQIKGESLVGNTGLSYTEYVRLHKWLYETVGRASECSHCHRTGLKKYEWALLKGCKYEYNADNFIQLCCSCHRKYDETIGRRTKISNSLKGKTAPNVRPIRIIHCESQVEMFFGSVREAANALSLSRTAIQNNLSGVSKKVGGFKCHYQPKN